MGWGTSFKADIYLSRQTFNNRYELSEKIKELEGYIEFSKGKLTSLAVATPKDIVIEKNDEGYMESPFDQILRKTTEIFEFMEENYRELNKLYQYQEYLEDNPDVDMNQSKDI